MLARVKFIVFVLIFIRTIFLFTRNLLQTSFKYLLSFSFKLFGFNLLLFIAYSTKFYRKINHRWKYQLISALFYWFFLFFQINRQKYFILSSTMIFIKPKSIIRIFFIIFTFYSVIFLLSHIPFFTYLPTH